MSGLNTPTTTRITLNCGVSLKGRGGGDWRGHGFDLHDLFQAALCQSLLRLLASLYYSLWEEESDEGSSRQIDERFYAVACVARSIESSSAPCARADRPMPRCSGRVHRGERDLGSSAR